VGKLSKLKNLSIRFVMTKKLKVRSIAFEDYISEEHFVNIRAVMKGVGTEHQQRQAIEVISKHVGGLNQLSFDSDPYKTAFNEGRRWVARFLLEVGAADPNYFKNNSNNK
jgi:hypothetical protein